MTNKAVPLITPEWNQCKRKAQYKTYEDAEIKALERTVASGISIHPYPCIYCGKYHIGRIEPC